MRRAALYLPGLVIALVISHSTFAATARSAKKAEADRSTLRLPQVLEKDDNLIGLRAAQGSTFGGNSVIGLAYERMIAPNFGFLGQLGYTHYEVRMAAGPISGTWDYTVLSIAAMATFHADVFHAHNLDTYLSGGIARHSVSSTWRSNVSGAPVGNADASTNVLVAYANFRYFIDSHWAVIGSVGTGLGTINLGADLVF